MIQGEAQSQLAGKIYLTVQEDTFVGNKDVIENVKKQPGKGAIAR